MHLVTVGLNHKTAPVEVRECLTFSGDHLAEGMLNLVRRPHVREGVILSTCNRTEVYGAVDALHAGVREITGFLRSCLKQPDLPLEEYLYTLSDLEVVQHLFSVAAGLDSMILGEAQILGQVKNAFHLALERGAVALHLGKLFRHAVEVGKRVRTETEIGESAVSVSYAAVELARKIFGE
ncbi:MAG: glutamyl-tRNA reductase [Bacillota bacterium]|nr:glutamyl-tRNA reductase [Bacillota bacterium]